MPRHSNRPPVATWSVLHHCDVGLVDVELEQAIPDTEKVGFYSLPRDMGAQCSRPGWALLPLIRLLRWCTT
jgi:hypothetical protein